MYWLSVLLTDGSWRRGRGVVLFSAGFCAQVILLQNLVYLGVPVQNAFALPALIGLWGAVRLYQRLRIEGLGRSINLRIGAAVFLSVFCLQLASAVYEGPANYYAKGRIDHFNYASLAEFIRSKPFTTPDADMLKEAWMVKAFQNREKRLGQSVAQAYVATASFSSVREAYGALCAFTAALLALVSFALARSFSIARPYAAAAAVWIGIAPATTHIHLDGYLSQASVLFVFPLLLLWSRLSDETAKFRICSGALLVSYLLLTYTEFFVIGIFLLGLLTIGFIALRARDQIRVPLMTVLLAVVLVPAYVPRAYAFAKEQYTIASSASPGLEALAPDGGTLYGWTRGLVQLPMTPSPLERQSTTTAGVVLVLLGTVGVYSRSRRNLFPLLAMLFTPAAFLLVLLSAPSLAKYPFMKICDSFAPFWILLIVRGIYVAALATRRHTNSDMASVAYVFPGVFLALGFCGYASEHRVVAGHEGSLVTLNTAEYRQMEAYVSAHPERTYIILHANGLAAGWLSLAARNSSVYLISRSLSDLPVPPGSLPFAKMPDLSDPTLLTTLTEAGYMDLAKSPGKADIEVSNPQGQDGSGTAVWYWLGDSMMIDFYRWAGDKNAEYPLSFGAEVGPANPLPLRKIRLINTETGHQYALEFNGRGQLSVPIVLALGKNSFRLESVSPTEQVTRIPSDPRKHLTRVFGITLGEPRSIRSDDPRILAEVSSTEVAPLIEVHNPQHEDRAGMSVWYWLGEAMEVVVTRRDQAKETLLYEISFDAIAGPANPDPKRRLLFEQLGSSNSKEFEFQHGDRAAFQFVAPAGDTRIRIKVLSPTEQKVHVPGDPRVHMVRVSDLRIRVVRGATGAKAL